jgi:hypothetical protein
MSRASLIAASKFLSGKILLGPEQPTRMANKTREQRVTVNI